jgi:TonB family protein
MKLLNSMKTQMLLPLVLMSAALVTPAYSNTFHGLNTPLNRNVGSAPNPTAQDIRNNRQRVNYPLESQMLNEEGTVGLKISLTEQGRVSDAIVENSSGFPRLDAAALEYAKTNWRYKPTDKDGQPIPAAVRVNVTFDMP